MYIYIYICVCVCVCVCAYMYLPTHSFKHEVSQSKILNGILLSQSVRSSGEVVIPKLKSVIYAH